jgi:hypothetical protein
MKNFYIIIILVVFSIFSSKAELEVISPNGGEQIHIESGHLIEWTGCEANDTLMIHFSTNNGRDWKFITDEATNFQYLWQNIPLFESDNCLLRLTYSNRNNIEVIPPEVEWSQNYGGSNNDEFSSAFISNDGKVYIAGSTKSDDNDINNLYGWTDDWIIKIDENGNKIWSKTYSKRNTNWINDIIELPDENLVATAFAWDNRGDVPLIWNFEIDTSGTLLNSKIDSSGRGIRLIEFNNKIYCIGENGDDSKFTKYDSNLNTIIDRTYGSSEVDWAESIIKTDDGNFYIMWCSRFF